MPLNPTIFKCACCEDACHGSGLIDAEISRDFPVCQDCYKHLRYAKAQLAASDIIGCQFPNNPDRLKGFLKD